MKTTLSMASILASLCLVPVTYGATIADDVLSGLSGSFSSSTLTYDVSECSVGASYTVTTTLSLEKIKEVMPVGSPLYGNNIITVSGLSGSTTYYSAVCTNYTSSGAAIITSGLYGSISTVFSNRAFTDLSSSSNVLSTVGTSGPDWNHVSQVALTFTVSTSSNTTYSSTGDSLYKGTTVYLTVKDDAGNVTTYWGNNSGQLYSTFNTNTLILNTDMVTSAYMFHSAVTANEALSLNNEAMAALVPESTSAGLSLLALSGMVLRRRRL